MPYATKLSTITGTFRNGVPTGGVLTDNGATVPTSNFRATVLSGSGVRASGIYSVDAVLPTAGTRNLVFTPTGMASGAVPGTFTARVRPISEAYAVPAAIPLGLMPHGNVPAGYLVESWPGFERTHLGPNQHLVGTMNGQTFAIQQDSEILWSNGNVRTARTVFALPAGLTAGTEQRLTVAVADGAPNRTPFITPQQLVAAHDFSLKSYGYDAGAQVFITSLRDIVTNFPRDSWGTNPLGGWDVFASGPLQVGIRAWRYRKDSVSGGTDKWRKDMLYVTAYSDGTFDFAAKVGQPNWDGPVAGATLGGDLETCMACIFEAYFDTTRIAAWGGPNDPRAVTIPATAFASDALLPSAVPGLETGMAVAFAPASGGSLPSGIVANKPYWLATTGAYFQGNLTLSTSRARAANKGEGFFQTAATNFSGNILQSTDPYISQEVFNFAPSDTSHGDALPSGVAQGTNYRLVPVSGGYALYPAHGPYNEDAAGTPITFSGGNGTINCNRVNTILLGNPGSGNIVVTPLVSTHYFNGSLLCATDGRAVRIGGLRVDIGIAYDEDYMSRGAQLWPVYDKADTRYPSTNINPLYYPQFPPWGFVLSGTGDNPGDNRIGYVNYNSLQALLLPYDAGFCQQMRRDAACWADQPIWHDDTVGGREIVVDNGPDDAGAQYPGMGPSRPDKWFNGYQSGPDASVQYSSGSGPNSSGYADGYSKAQLDGSHMPCPWPVAAYMTGHPMYADLGVGQANSQNLYGNATQTLGNKTYYCICSLKSQQGRGVGWSLRAFGFAEKFTPSARPEAAYIRHSLDSMAQWGAHCVLTASPAQLAIGQVGHMNGGSNDDFGFFFYIEMGSLYMELLHAERPALRTYVAALANLHIGMLNDASPTGGTGAIADNYHSYLQTVPYSYSPSFPTLRAAIAGNDSSYRLSPPYPAVGFYGGAAFSTDPASYAGAFSNPNAFDSQNYVIMTRAALAMAKTAGIVSLNGDDAGAVHDLLNTRIFTSPCKGVHFSSPNWGGSFGDVNLRNQFVFAIEPG